MENEILEIHSASPLTRILLVVSSLLLVLDTWLGYQFMLGRLNLSNLLFMYLVSLVLLLFALTQSVDRLNIFAPTVDKNFMTLDFMRVTRSEDTTAFLWKPSAKSIIKSIPIVLAALMGIFVIVASLFIVFMRISD